MFDPISDKKFAEALKDADFTGKFNDVFYKDPLMTKYLERFALLEYYPEKFNEFNPADIHHNKYYWFSMLLYRYEQVYGYDNLNLTQQREQVLVNAEGIEGNNWNIYETIEEQVKKFHSK